jgi:5-methyltetrahydropteroyltriglutamate--homocysteine methyltransferase
MVTVEEFVYARARARRPVKVTFPSPIMLYQMWSKTRSVEAYPDPFELFADGAELLREEIRELAALGCRYVQIDAPELGQLVDPERLRAWEAIGIPPQRALNEGVDILNHLAEVPGVSFGLHLCRGNFKSRWIAQGGYERLSKEIFARAGNYDMFLLEYDDERSGGFAPLADLPDDKVAVLGLVSTKRENLEDPNELLARIDEAARHFPREQLALSTQCGFASIMDGNEISEESQEGKLELVARVAHEAWGL